MGVANNILMLRNAQGQLERLVFGANKKIAGVDVDVIFSYKYQTTVRITTNPVQQGVQVNDHRIIEPRKLAIQVGINNIVGVKDLLMNLDKATAMQFGKLMIFGNRFDSKSRVAATYNQLLTAQYTGDLFDVETPLGTFKNMLITAIDKDQTAESISVFQGTITMQEFIQYTAVSTVPTLKAGVNSPLNIGYQVPSKVTSSLLPSGVSLPWS